MNLGAVTVLMVFKAELDEITQEQIYGELGGLYGTRAVFAEGPVLWLSPPPPAPLFAYCS